jgi:hypothetical protein
VAEPRHIHRLQGFVDAPADVVPSHAEVFRAECHIILDDGGDDLILRILEHRADAMPGIAVFARIR